jgi:hypothetical protein
MSEVLNDDNDEQSLKDVLLKVKKIYLLLRPKFPLIFFLSLIGGALGLAYAFLIPVKHEARLSFMVDAGKLNSMGGASQLASTFGLGTFGSGNNFDTKKVAELLMSNKINSITLFEKEAINGNTDYLANHFINSLELKKDKEFINNDSINDFIEFNHADYSKFTQKENRVLNLILDRIIGEHAILSVEVTKNEIIIVKLASESKVFAKYYVEHLVSALTNFYVSSSIKKEKISLDVLSYREDSVKKALYSAEYAHASFKDENLRMVKAQGYIEELRLKRNIEILTAMYVEIIKNKEMANFVLLNKTPLFQLIDEPRFPLKIVKKSKAVFSIIGCFFVFVLTSCIIILKKYRFLINDTSNG